MRWLRWFPVAFFTDHCGCTHEQLVQGPYAVASDRFEPTTIRLQGVVTRGHVNIQVSALAVLQSKVSEFNFRWTHGDKWPQFCFLAFT